MKVSKCFCNEKHENRTNIKTPEEIRQVFHTVSGLEDEDDSIANDKKKKAEDKLYPQISFFISRLLITHYICD